MQLPSAKQMEVRLEAKNYKLVIKKMNFLFS